MSIVMMVRFLLLSLLIRGELLWWGRTFLLYWVAGYLLMGFCTAIVFDHYHHHHHHLQYYSPSCTV